MNLRPWAFGVLYGLGSSICPCLGLGGGLWCSVSDGLGLPSVFEGLGLLSFVFDGLGLPSVFEGLGLPSSVSEGLGLPFSVLRAYWWYLPVTLRA